MDPEQMFLAFRDAYVGAMKAKEIAERDAAQEAYQAHVEMHEMDAWDDFAIQALKYGIGADRSDLAASALACATFANELLKHRRAMFLMGDDDKS